jgi:hypothetical protein
MVMDNRKDSYFLWENDEGFKQMLMEQNIYEIKFRRQTRMLFRALVGKTCSVDITRKESHNVPDGWEETEVYEMRKKKRRYSEVMVDVS